MIIVRLPSVSISVDLELEACRNIKAVYESGKLLVSWEDPGDVVYKGEVITRQRGTKLVCRKDRYPENVRDGDLLVAETTLNTYKDEPFVIEDVDPEDEFYLMLFPYSSRMTYNFNTLNRIYAKAGHHILFQDEDGKTLKEEWIQTGDVPYAPDTQSKDGHDFDKWIPDLAPAYSDQTYQAQYCKIVQYYNFDGSQLLYTEQVSPGSAAVWADQPAKDSSASENFTFSGWSRTPNGEADADVRNSITEDTKLYAAYTSELREFTVRFISEGVAVQTSQVKYGNYATFTGTLTQDKAARHDFDRWDKEPSTTPITEPTDFNAVFKHRIDYYIDQNTVVASEQVSNGQNAVSIPSPAKEQTAEFSYEFGYFADQYYAPVEDAFAGTQTASLTNVQSDVDVYAVYKAIRRSYDITFVYNDTYAVQSVKYGAMPTDNSSYKVNNSQGREFSKWDSPITTVTGPKTYTAVYKLFARIYSTQTQLRITLQVDPGTTIAQFPTIASYPDGDADRYDYQVAGYSSSWIAPSESPVFTDISKNVINSDTDLYAVWKITTVRYRVRYYNGTTLANTEWVTRGQDANYSTIPEYTGSYDPAKYEYTFAYWTTVSGPEVNSNPTRAVLSNVQADLDVYAYFSESKLFAEVAFYNETTLLYIATVTLGGTAVYVGENPTKNSTVSTEYTFSGWASSNGGTADPNILKNITANKNVYAAYLENVRKYTITWNNADGTKIDEEQVPYGTVPTHSEPIHPEHPQLFEFDKWVPNPVAVTANATYTASYHRIYTEITDSWFEINSAMNDGTYKTKYPIGSYVSVDMGDEGVIEYEVIGFDKDDTGNGTASITWAARQALKTGVRWTETGSNNGGYASSSLINYMENTVYNLFPSEVSRLIVPVNKTVKMGKNGGGATNTVSQLKVWPLSNREIFGTDSSYAETSGPIYDEAFILDSDRIRNISGSSTPAVWWLRSSHYNASGYVGAITVTGTNGTDNNGSVSRTNYVVPCFCTSYKPETYTVTFMANGEVYDVVTVAPGGTAIPNKPNPTKASTVSHNFAFAGWSIEDDGSVDSDALTNVNDNRTVYAIWTQTTRQYTITVEYADQTATLKVDYGVVPELSKYETDDATGHNFDKWNVTPYKADKDQTYVAIYKVKVDFYNGEDYIGTKQTSIGGDVTADGLEIPDGPYQKSVVLDIDPLTREIKSTWEEIATAVDEGTYKDQLQIGDYKTLNLGDTYGTVEMEIVAFDADDLTNGSGKGPITWISKKCLKGTYEWRWNNADYSTGGFKFSNIRTIVEDSITQVVGEDPLPYIKAVNKTSRLGGHDDGMTVSESYVVWVPSAREVYGWDSNSSDYIESSGPIYSEKFKDKESCIKSDWWLRTAYYGDPFSAILIDRSGNCYEEEISETHYIPIGFVTGGIEPISYGKVSESGEILDSWLEIHQACKDNKHTEVYKIGNWKSVNYSKIYGENVPMEIVAFNTDEITSGGKAPITFISKDCLKTTKYWNSQNNNKGGYPTSNLKSTIEAAYFYIEDSDSPSCYVVPVNKSSAMGKSDNGIENSASYIAWAPSLEEVGDAMSGIGSYKEHSGITYSIKFKDEASCVKHAYGTNTATDWWLRTSDRDYTTTSFCVTNTGTPGMGNCSSQNGVVIGFCIN